MVELTPLDGLDEFPMRIIYCTLGKVVLYSCWGFFPPEMILLGFSFSWPFLAWPIRFGWAFAWDIAPLNRTTAVVGCSQCLPGTGKSISSSR